MKLTLIKSKKSQSVLEYVLTALVFTAVGFTTFVAANQASMTTLRGQKDTYHSENTLMGKIAYDSLPQEAIVYPSSVNGVGPDGVSFSQRAQGYDGTIAGEQVATNAKETGAATSVGQPRGDLYEYQEENWSIDKDHPYEQYSGPVFVGSSGERLR